LFRKIQGRGALMGFGRCPNTNATDSVYHCAEGLGNPETMFMVSWCSGSMHSNERGWFEAGRDHQMIA